MKEEAISKTEVNKLIPDEISNIAGSTADYNVLK
jgi:hypothetical protein